MELNVKVMVSVKDVWCLVKGFFFGAVECQDEGCFVGVEC